MKNRYGKKLIARLYQNFANVPKPHKLGVNTYEGDDVEDFFKEKTWQELTLTSLKQSKIGVANAYLTCMTDEAQAYYMPAYLRILLKFSADKTLEFFDVTLYQLRLKDEGTTDLSRYSHQRFMSAFANRYTQEQKETVADILYHLQLKNYDQGMGLVKAAYDSYWYQYKSQPKQ